VTIPTPDEIFAEFQRRFPDRVRPIDESLIPVLFKRRRRIAFGSTLAIGIFAAVMAAFYESGHVNGFELMVTVLPLTLIYIIALLVFYRCPRCGGMPLAQPRLYVVGIQVKKFDSWVPGLNLNPEMCHTCGAMLR
jgi:hypothetical protein